MAADSYVTRAELADLLGVEVRTVTNWLKLPADPAPGPVPSRVAGRERTFPVKRCIAWHVEYRAAEALRRAKGPAVGVDLDAERARLTKAQADKAEMERDALRGSLIPIGVHESRVAAICDRLAAALNQMPTKFAGAVVGAKDEPSARAVLESARDFAFRATQAVADEIEDEPFTDDDHPAQEAA